MIEVNMLEEKVEGLVSPSFFVGDGFSPIGVVGIHLLRPV
jgi:hypothetical protein